VLNWAYKPSSCKVSPLIFLHRCQLGWHARRLRLPVRAQFGCCSGCACAIIPLLPSSSSSSLEKLINQQHEGGMIFFLSVSFSACARHSITIVMTNVTRVRNYESLWVCLSAWKVYTRPPNVAQKLISASHSQSFDRMTSVIRLKGQRSKVTEPKTQNHFLPAAI